MKQKDIAVIIVVAAFAAVIAFFLSSKVFVSASSHNQMVQKVDPISSDFTQPDSKYFNPNSIDPALNSTTSDQTNQNPFGN